MLGWPTCKEVHEDIREYVSFRFRASRTSFLSTLRRVLDLTFHTLTKFQRLSYAITSSYFSCQTYPHGTEEIPFATGDVLVPTQVFLRKALNG